MLKLKFQYFGHLMRRADSFEKTLMLGKVEGRRRRRRGHKSPDTPGSPEGNTEGPGTAASEPLLPS